MCQRTLASAFAMMSNPLPVDNPTTRKKGRELTREAFDLLLARLDADRERAGERYEAARRKLVKFFSWWGSEFPEDHADETINRVVGKIAGGEQIVDINKYFTGVARLVFAEYVKSRVRNRAALDGFTQHQSAAEDPEQKEARLECYELCLRSLSEASHELVVAYYQEESRRKATQRQELAERLGIPLNLLRTRAFRIRNTLKDCVRDCLRRLSGGL